MCVCAREGIRKARKKSPAPCANIRKPIGHYPNFAQKPTFYALLAQSGKILVCVSKVSKNGLKMRKRKKRSRSPALSSKSNLISCVSENPAPSGKTVSPRTRCPSTRTRPQNLSYPAYLCSRKIFRPPAFASRIFRPLTSSMSSGTASS